MSRAFAIVATVLLLAAVLGPGWPVPMVPGWTVR